MKKILLFENDEQTIMLLNLLLKQKYHLASVDTCIDVLNQVDIHQPDLILMDLRIPKTGGEEATTLIKSDPNKQHIPVIIISADDDLETKVKRCGADDYIAKPFDIGRLEEKIESYV